MEKKKTIKKLTQKQQKALDHFRVHGDKSAAYRHAYQCNNMKPDTIHKRSAELFRLPHIKGCLRAVRKKQENKLDVSENRVLAEMAAIGFSNAANLFDQEGSPILISKLDIPTQRAIKSITVKRFIERNGPGKDDFEEVEVQKIELHPKLPALVKIAEIKGMLKEVDKNSQRPVEVTVNINGQSIESN